jgi:hypothetical protein
MNYPIQGLLDYSIRIQEMLGDYHTKTSASLFMKHSPDKTREEEWEEQNLRYDRISSEFMKEAGTKILPHVQSLLAEIEARLTGEEKTFADRISPILENAKQFATHPTNPLGYNELASLLVSLRGHLLVGKVVKPTVFVGFRYVKEDQEIVRAFIDLLILEGFDVRSGKTAKAEDIDDKVKSLISSCEGTIVIFTKTKELKDGGWSTSIWLSDEKAFALGKSQEVGLFFEDCISEENRAGIQGNLEYIEFNRNTLQNAILEAIPYLRDFKQKILDSKKGQR